LSAPLEQRERVNVLLVDDQPGKLLSYEAILGGLGENLVKASSAREALERLLKHDFAVVLIDVQMPEVDGFELAAMIREHPRFQHIALIFVSAIHLSDLDRIKGYEAGAVDYVPVPVVPEVLRAKVRVFAELHRKTRELERLNADLEQRVADRTEALAATAEALKSLNRDLETRIDERTREREEALAQLFEAQKIDTIGQLTGGVAHDFNNLLMAMLGSLQLLQKRMGDDPKSQRLVDNALKAAERGSALTQRLLAFARRQELRPSVVQLPTLIAGMKDLLARALGPTVTWEENFPRGLPAVLVDPNQLELALLNLTVNARDAMPEGGVITLSASPIKIPAGLADAPAELPQGDYVRVTITDTGRGMEADVLARATEPFYTTKGVGKGTGLGLSMVHGLAAQSGGVLRLFSEAGKGTRAELWLPLAVSSGAGDIEASPRVEPDRQEAGEKIAILVVEDDPLVSVGTVAMLEDLGHAVMEVSSGVEALALLSAGCKIDVVVTDFAMPGMTGLDLAVRLRKLRPTLPVILASGFADLGGAKWPDFDLPRLPKPFRQADLAALIAQVQRSALASSPARRGPAKVRQERSGS